MCRTSSPSEFCAASKIPSKKSCFLRVARPSSKGPQLPIPLSKRIRQPIHKREFWPNHRQVRLNFFCQRHCRGHITRINGHAFRFRCDSAVARRTPDFFHQRALLESPDQRVLAPASANHQNFHSLLTLLTPLSNDSRPSETCQPSPLPPRFHFQLSPAMPR